MISLLRHLLDASYLYAQNPTPLGHWGVSQLLGALALLVGLALAWRRARRAKGAGAAPVTFWGCLAGLILLILHIYTSGALSARIWYLSASALAIAAPLAHWLLSRRWPPQAYLLSKALAARLTPDDPPLPWTWQAALGLIHLLGFYLVSRQGVGYWPAGLALAALCLAGLAQARHGGNRGRPPLEPNGGWRGLRIELLTPLALLYMAGLLRLLLAEGLGIPVEVYQAFPYPDPWSPWFDLSVVGTASVAWVLISTGAFVWRSARPRPAAGAWLGLGMLALGLGWYVATAIIHLSHGASGSDPYCYLQMAVDLAEHGTALHDFPLVALAREANIPVWPAVHVGYSPPARQVLFHHMVNEKQNLSAAGTLAPTVWPIAWPLILVPFYWLGGEAAILWAAPLCALLAALLTWELARATGTSHLHHETREWKSSGAMPRIVTLSASEGSRSHKAEILRFAQNDSSNTLNETNTREGPLRQMFRPYTAGLAGLIAITSYESLLRSLVPMADAAAQMLTVLTLLCLVRARRRDALPWAALAGVSLGLTYFVRHAQLPLGLAALPVLLGAPWPWGRRLRHLGAFALAALVCALPDLLYHAAALGSLWASESSEWFLISWRNMGPTFLSLLRDGLLRRGEFGYLLPFIIYGAWRQGREATERPWAAMLGLGFGGVLLFNLSYSALRLRDLIPLFPFLALWAGRGIEELWERAASSRAWPTLRRALALALVLMALAARTTGTLGAPWQPRLWTFGYVSAAERAGYERLRDALPPGAVVGTGLNSGAVERYTGHQAVRPASWSDAEFARFLGALGAEGRALYLLDDGEEMESFLPCLFGAYRLRHLGEFVLPTFGLGGQDYGRRAGLYVVE